MLQKIRADQDTLQQKNPYTIDKNTPTPFSTPIWFKYRYDELIEAFTNPQPGLPEGYFEGRTSLSENRDVLFLYLPTIPNGPIVLKGIKNKINRIRVVGSGVKLSWKILNKLYWSDVPGIIYINLPPSACDSECTVIAVQLDGEIELQE
jgi:alpha-L-fucosidase